MDEKTIFIYENALGTLRFAYDSPFWITETPELSSVQVDVSSSRGRQQIGSTIVNQTVQPKEFTIDGVIFDPIPVNRERLLHVMVPRVKSVFTVIENGNEWFLNVVPSRTPDIDPGNGSENFQVGLYADYPYWQTVENYARQVAGLISLFKFPFHTGGTWHISKFSDDYYALLGNSGNVPSGVKVTFAARRAISSPQILHMDTGKKLAVIKDMVAGEKIIVSTVYGSKGCIAVDVAGNETNGFKYLTIDSDLSFELLPGNNLLRGDAVDNRTGMSIQIEAPLGVRSGV